MSWEVKSVQLNGDKVTFKFEDRASWGFVRERRQMTFRRRQFELALQQAEITVPWTDVKS